MGRHFVHGFDEDKVNAIAHEVDAAIDAASLGTSSWDEVPNALTSAFRGSFSGLWNMNFTESRLNFQSWSNVEPEFSRSYAEHFAYVNPWTSFWSKGPSGLVALSEEVAPAHLYSRTEFYNDWLVPQQDARAAAGLKLLGNRGETVLFVLHFPLQFADRYGPAAAEVMKRIRGAMGRSITLAGILQDRIEGAMSTAALVERGHSAAFVVEGNRVIREANPLAERLFSSGDAVTVRGNRCFMANSDADVEFGSMLERMWWGVATQTAQLVFRTSGGAWKVTMCVLPAAAIPANSPMLLPPRRLVLVVVHDLAGIGHTADLSLLKVFASLTPAEIAFCQRLAQGDSVAVAADHLGIAKETARTRLKSIFQKTQTSRQGQLMLLLSRLQK